MTGPGGAEGTFALGEDFEGTGRLERDGQVAGALRWQPNGDGTYEVFMGRYDASGAYWAAVWAPRPFFVVGTMGIMDIAVKGTDPNADDKAIDAKQSAAEE